MNMTMTWLVSMDMTLLCFHFRRLNSVFILSFEV